MVGVIGRKKTNRYNVFILIEIFIISSILVFSASVTGYFLNEYKNASDLIAAGLVVSFALFVMLVSGIGLMGTQLIWVIGKKKEIGLLMSFGAKKGNIVNMVLFNSIKKVIVTGVLGIIAGYIITPVISRILYLPGSPNITTVVSAFILLLIFTIAATLYPALKAASITPVEALRGTHDINSIKSKQTKKIWAVVVFYLVLTVTYVVCVNLDYSLKKEMETDIINTSGPPPAIGTKVPDFEVLDGGNNILSNEDLMGSRHLIVIVDMQCSVSIDLLVSLNSIEGFLSETGVNVKLILVHKNYSNKSTQSVLQEKNIYFPLFEDHEKSVKWAFKVNAWPAMYLVDEEGTIIYRQIGYTDEVINMLRTVISK